MKKVRPYSIVSGLKALKRLDLKMVAKKLMDPKPEGQGWTLKQVREAEKWYRRFLELGVRYPHESIVPNLPIDLFWHQHILDTRAYAVDCDRIFGEFLHHFPYFGIRGKQDAQNRDNAFDRTNKLYELHFGDNCRNMDTFHKPTVPEDCMVSLRGNDGSKKATACSPPCTSAACQGGGTCRACTADRARAVRAEGDVLVVAGCSFEPTKCAQRCGRGSKGQNCSIGDSPDPAPKCGAERTGMRFAMVGAGCNHSGFGTGCGQRCGRGK